MDKGKLREESKLRQQKITEDWKAIAAQYPHVLEDYFQYIDGLAGFYRSSAEEQEMHGLPLDDHRINQCLQQARTCAIFKTYITSRIDQDVAQPIKSK